MTTKNLKRKSSGGTVVSRAAPTPATTRAIIQLRRRVPHPVSWTPAGDVRVWLPWRSSILARLCDRVLGMIIATPLALPQRFQGGPPIAELGGGPADDVIAVVIDGAEDPAPAVRLRVEPRRVGAPHLVRPRRSDRAGVRRVAIGRPQASRGQELVL